MYIYMKNFREPGWFSGMGLEEKESMMGDLYKAIEQKWGIGWITTGISWILAY